MGVLTGGAGVAGVIGWPVSHSRSPRLHGHWLARHGIDGAYVPLAVAPDDLGAAVRGLRAAGFRGLNVTLPHKVAVMALCDRLEPSRGAWQGRSTRSCSIRAAWWAATRTGRGSWRTWSRMAWIRQPGPALLLGAGGAARAIAAALLDAGAAVTVANRTAGRAKDLAGALPGLRTIAWERREAALEGHALLVNTTQLGMAGQPPLAMALHRAAPGLVVADIVYAPAETALLADAAAHGLRVVGGVGMLLHQAVPGFAQWFGLVPSVDAALEQAVLA